MRTVQKRSSPAAFGRLAGASYAILAVFGLAVWHLLVFTSLPPGATPGETLKALLAQESGGMFLQVHLAATLVALGLALVLLAWPPRTKRALSVALAAASAYVVVSWLYFALDMLVLPCMALASLAWGYWLILESQRSAV